MWVKKKSKAKKNLFKGKKMIFFNEKKIILFNKKKKGFLFILQKGQKTLKKSNCANFFTKIIFFTVFDRKYVLTSSKGTRNHEKKILSSSREIWEILVKISPQKGLCDFGDFFRKKEHSDFFLRIFQKICRNIYFQKLKQLRKMMK